MSRQLRSISLTLALVLLAAGAAQAWPATGHRAVQQAAPGESFFTTVWNRLVSLLTRPEAPAPQGNTVPQKAGCSMDPNGQPLLNCIQ